MYTRLFFTLMKVSFINFVDFDINDKSFQYKNVPERSSVRTGNWVMRFKLGT